MIQILKNPKLLIGLILLFSFIVYSRWLWSVAQADLLADQAEDFKEKIEERQETEKVNLEARAAVEKEKEIVEKVVFRDVIQTKIVSNCDSQSFDDIARLLNKIP